MDRWEQIDSGIDRVEGILLVLLLGLMIGVAFLQIVLRNLFATGLSWADPLVRNLVVWVGFIGAALATREGKHITIDLILRGLPPRAKGAIERITHLFSSVICGLLTFAAIKFIRNEALMGSRTFWEIPTWVPGLILPATFALMTFRFGLRALKPLSLQTHRTSEQSKAL